MIVFDLSCRAGGHVFEGWFGSSDDFARQQESGLLLCPKCGSADVVKAAMAPAVGRKGNQAPVARPTEPREAPGAPAESEGTSAAQLTPEARQALAKLAAMQKAVLEKSTWVGRKFADEARAMHYGEREAAPIHGEADRDEAEELAEEGIEIAALPFPIAPPDALN